MIFVTGWYFTDAPSVMQENLSAIYAVLKISAIFLPIINNSHRLMPNYK